MESVTACAIAAPALASAATVLPQIKNFVVIYLENRSFDHLFGDFPGTNNRSKASAESLKQLDKQGVAYTTLPPVQKIEHLQPTVLDTRFPTDLPNAPFDIGKYMPPNVNTGDLKHNYYNNINQINDGKMNQFVAWCDAGALANGYYDWQQPVFVHPTGLAGSQMLRYRHQPNARRNDPIAQGNALDTPNILPPIPTRREAIQTTGAFDPERMGHG